MRSYLSPDGTRWLVEILVPGSSNAMVAFRHPEGGTARRDRYAWYQADTPEARNVTARLQPAKVLERLTDERLARLFRRSMPISAADTPLAPPVTHWGA